MKNCYSQPYLTHALRNSIRGSRGITALAAAIIIALFQLGCGADGSQGKPQAGADMGTGMLRMVPCISSAQNNDDCDEARSNRDASLPPPTPMPPPEMRSRPEGETDGPDGGNEAQEPMQQEGSSARLTNLVPSRRPDAWLIEGRILALSALKVGDMAFATYVSREILIQTEREEAVVPILQRSQLELIESIQFTDTQWLHRARISGPAPSLEQATQTLRDAGFSSENGLLLASDPEIIEAYGIVLSESARGVSVSLNPSIKSAGGVKAWTEAPDGPADYDPNASNWSYLSDGALGYGVFRSWALLDHADRLVPASTIAVVDSGFHSNPDLEHIDDATSLYPGPTGLDSGGHGTHIAAAIAAEGDNNFGTLGVAQGVSRLRLIDYGVPTLFHGLAGLGRALALQADIINLSWTSGVPVPGPVDDPSGGINEILADAAGQSLLVAAAGNSGLDLDTSESTTFICEASAVLCVGGLTVEKQRAQESNYGSSDVGSKVDIYGPFQLYSYSNPASQVDDDRLAVVTGTSMSAAFVSAVAALIRSADPGLSPEELKDRILSTSTSSTDNPNHRIIHSYSAVHATIGETPPTLEITQPTQAQIETVRRRQPFTLEAESFDFDSDEEITIRWSSDLDGELGEGMRVRAALSQFGRHTVTATATDRSGQSSEQSFIVDVEDHLPLLEVLHPVQGVVLHSGAREIFRASAIDTDDRNQEIDCDNIRWIDINENGVRQLGTGCEVQVDGLIAGVHVLRIIATDDTGNENVVILSFMVAGP